MRLDSFSSFSRVSICPRNISTMQIRLLEDPAEGLKTYLRRQHFLTAFRASKLGLEEVCFAAAAKLIPETPRFQSLGLTPMPHDQQTKNERKANTAFAKWRRDEANELQMRNI